MFALFVSCDQSDECELPSLDGKNITFFGSISQLKTKAGDVNWDNGDAIGVYAITAGKSLSNGVYDGKANIKYTTTGTERFLPASQDNAIKFLMDGVNLDFVAYYPYQTSISNNEFPIDLTNQGEPSNIDFLYSNNSLNNNMATSTVRLLFKHMLSKVVFVIKAEYDTDLSGLAVEFDKTFITNGSFDLENGTVSAGNTQKKISPFIKFTDNNKTAIVSAILMPGQSLSDFKIKITHGGKVYNDVVLKNISATESTKKYTQNIILKRNGTMKVVDLIGNIEDWNEGNPGGTDITITPDDNGNNNGGNNNGGNNNGNGGNNNSNATNLSAGSDFEDWDAFKGGLNNYGVQKYVSQSNDGRNGGKAMLINGVPSKNDYVFTINVPSSGNSLKGKSKIIFYIKGTCPEKSMTFNVYNDKTREYNGKTYQEYAKFNLGVLGTSEVVLTSQPRNSYTGSIDTNGQWVKVTLDISGLDIATKGSAFALKVGKTGNYNVLIDDITVE